MKVVTASEMSRIEKLAFQDGADESTFMEQAGLGIAKTVLSLNYGSNLTLLVSKGNNSGDAYVAGRYLLQRGWKVQAIEIPCTQRSSLCEINRKSFLSHGGQAKPYTPGCIKELPQTVILDGLFGTGFNGEMASPYSLLCREVNTANAPIVAIDIPSGLNGTTGLASQDALQATDTIFLGLPKLGFFINDGPRHIGNLHYVNFGLKDHDIDRAQSTFKLFQSSWIQTNTKALSPTRHKYESGAACVIAGSKNMPGAAMLTCTAALNSGAGIVYLHTEKLSSLSMRPWDIISSEGMLNAIPESSIKKAKALAIGPGLNADKDQLTPLLDLLNDLEIPAVIDAGALNLLSQAKTYKLPKRSLLTPHVQEMRRLLHSSSSQVDEAFLQECKNYSSKFNVSLLLKGSMTFIFHPEKAPVVMPIECPGLAKAGTGDVLTGIIVALMSRGHSAYDSAFIATYLHKLAGQALCHERTHLSLTATKLAHKLPDVITENLAHANTLLEDFELCSF